MNNFFDHKREKSVFDKFFRGTLGKLYIKQTFFREINQRIIGIDGLSKLFYTVYMKEKRTSVYTLPWEEIQDHVENFPGLREPLSPEKKEALQEDTEAQEAINEAVFRTGSKVFEILLKNNDYELGEKNKNISEYPEITYTKNGQNLSIQGVSHIAPKAFYDTIQQKIDAHDGILLYEGVGSEEEKEKKEELKEKFQNIHPILGSIIDAYPKIAQNLEQDFQGKSLDEKGHKGARHADVSMTEFLDNLEKETTKEEKEVLQKTAPFFQFFFRRCPNIIKVMMGGKDEYRGVKRFLKHISGQEREDEEFEMFGKQSILEDRDKNLVKKIKEAEKEKQDIHVNYGAEHLSGVHEQLLNEGWDFQKMEGLVVKSQKKKTRKRDILKAFLWEMPQLIFMSLWYNRSLKKLKQLLEKNQKENKKNEKEKIKDEREELKQKTMEELRKGNAEENKIPENEQSEKKEENNQEFGDIQEENMNNNIDQEKEEDSEEKDEKDREEEGKERRRTTEESDKIKKAA